MSNIDIDTITVIVHLAVREAVQEALQMLKDEGFIHTATLEEGIMCGEHDKDSRSVKDGKSGKDSKIVKDGRDGATGKEAQKTKELRAKRPLGIESKNKLGEISAGKRSMHRYKKDICITPYPLLNTAVSLFN